jgi:hypothetical protein
LSFSESSVRARALKAGRDARAPGVNARAPGVNVYAPGVNVYTHSLIAIRKLGAKYPEKDVYFS